MPKLEGCAPDTAPIDGACVRVGVTTCATGFVADAAGGCRAVQPAAPCGRGQVAWLGETACHELVDCGTDKFGNPPTDEPLLYVDASADAATGDGTRDKPFATLAAAIATIPRASRTRIALAEGTYAEQLTIDRAVDLWGRCPSKVNLAPTSGDNVYAIQVMRGASTIERVGISGAFGGVAAVDSNDVIVRDTWIHDVEDAGVNAQGLSLPGALLARHVLIERGRDLGGFALGGALTLEESVVRETRTAKGALRGYGVAGEDDSRGQPATVVVRASIVERNHETAVFGIGSTVVVERSLLKDTVVSADAAFGLWVTASSASGQAGSLALSDSVLEGMAVSAINLVETKADIARTTIRNTESSPVSKLGGQCLFSERTDLTMTDSACFDARQIGLQMAGGRAAIERVVVAGVRPDGLGQGGIGLATVPNVERTDLRLASSAFSSLVDTGIFIGGGVGAISNVAVRDVVTLEGSTFGDGLVIVAFPSKDVWFPSEGALENVLIERAARAGVAAFADTALTLRGLRVSCAALPIVVSGFRGDDLVPMGAAPLLDDGGGNLCGCGRTLGTCKGSTVGMKPVSLTH